MKKFGRYKIYLPVLILIFLTGCATQSVCTIEGCDYNEKKNRTDYFVLPYGAVSIPGKWERTHYNQVSHQQFFTNSDSIIISIAFGPYDKYEFNADKPKKGLDFALAFYEWDSKYFMETKGAERELIEIDSINNFVIYRIFGETGNSNIDAIFLVGEKNGFASNLAVMKTDKWTKEYKTDFLKEIYLAEKE